MTPDDAPIPGSDQVARAARRGLDNLASAPGELSWEAVQSGVRRVHRLRMAAIGSACAVLLLGTGVAVAATGNYDSGPLRVRGAGASTTTAATTTTPTTALDLPTTPSTADTTPGLAGTTTTSLPRRGVAAIEGTVTIATSTWVAEQPASFTLKVHNTSDQEYRFGPEMTLGIVVQGFGSGGCIGVDHGDLVLAPGEQRTYSSAFTPRPDMIGTADIYTAVLYAGDNYSNCLSTDGFAAIPIVPVTIVPPGWVEGQTLDPSQGTWTATLSADSTVLAAGESTPIHVEVRNAGAQAQRTDGYGSLAVVCYAPGIEDGYPVPIAATTIEPGAQQSFTVMFPGEKVAGPGTARCSLGMTFHGVPNSGAVEHIDSDYLGIEVNDGASTTTVPETTP
jgi:hypothetical protein